MSVIGFHASHEQIPPSQLLRDVQAAEAAGFGAAMCSDHYFPWGERQGHSGFAWSWLGAALATTSLSFGVVHAPGQRYHPAISAQMIATLGEMFPGRFWAALGSGQALNEHVTGDPWPPKETRDRRLEECTEVMRRLLAGEEVSHHGLVTVDRARVWSLADPVPDLVAAAVTPATAARVAAWADGLITVNQPVETLRRVIDAYRDNGGRGDVRLQVHVSYDPDPDQAMAIARDQWRTNVFPPPVAWELDTAAAFDAVARHASDDDVRTSVRVSADLGQHAAWLAEDLDLGFDAVMVHHVGQQQAAFLDAFGAHVLPQVLAGRTGVLA
jgi:probable non-F420 flavinoid oxidoreductase